MVKTIKYLLLTAVTVALLAASCSGGKNSSSETKGIWMQTEPIQCLQNPWEEAWLENNNKDYQAYPKGKPREVEPEEARIIQAYFEDQGVTVLDWDFESFGDDVMVCDACSCPQGFTLYLKVKEADLATLKDYNFIEATNYPEDEE